MNARLQSLLEEYHTLRRGGRGVKVEDLCRGDAELASQLQRLLESQQVETQTPAERQGVNDETVPAIDRYEVLGKLGEGGMGAVYRARDRALGREVALKVVRPDALSSEMRQRMLTEARAVAALDHVGIVKVYDVGEWSPPGETAAPYLSLEFVAGGSLTRHLAAGPLATHEAARLVRLMAEAMAHAHERGVVHRDLKPDNVLLTHPAADSAGAPVPKITDFGLAKKLDDRSQTQTGAIMGTPAYMAPEQAEGQAAGPAADVYSLGVVLYRLLAGKVPFDAPSVVDLLYKVCHEEPTPLHEVRPDVPPALEEVCRACMCKDAAKRPSAAELASRLAGPIAPAESMRETVDLPAKPRRRPWWVLAAGVAAAVAMAGVAWAAWPKKPAAVTKDEDPEPKKPAAVAKVEPLRAELTVRVWSPKRGAKGLRIGIDPGAVPVREDEQLQAEVKLSEPAYAYLLWVDGKGDVTPLYPWNDDEVKVDSLAAAPPAAKAMEFRNPSRASKGWPLDDTAGLDLWLLLVRRTPWPAGKSLAETLGKVTAAPLDPQRPGEVAVRGWDDGRFVEALRLDVTRRPKGAADEIDDQLQRLVGRLQDDFEAIRAVQFAHVAARK